MNYWIHTKRGLDLATLHRERCLEIPSSSMRSDFWEGGWEEYSDRDAALVAQITKAGKHELSVLYGDEELEIAVDYEEEIGVSDREMRSSLPLSVAAGYAHYSKCAL